MASFTNHLRFWDLIISPQCGHGFSVAGTAMDFSQQAGHSYSWFCNEESKSVKVPQEGQIKGNLLDVEEGAGCESGCDIGRWVSAEDGTVIGVNWIFGFSGVVSGTIVMVWLHLGHAASMPAQSSSASNLALQCGHLKWNILRSSLLGIFIQKKRYIRKCPLLRLPQRHKKHKSDVPHKADTPILLISCGRQMLKW